MSECKKKASKEVKFSDLLDFLTTFDHKFWNGMLRLSSDGSGIFYSPGGEYYKKEIKFESIDELKKIVKKI